MRERPILFSGPMVCSILAGEKTQTRRVITPQPQRVEKYEPHDPELFEDGLWRWHTGTVVREATAVRCPFGVPGDQLWVRETWAQQPDTRIVAYRADGACGAWMGDSAGGRLWLSHGKVGASGVPTAPPEWRGRSFGLGYVGGRWRPSIHMPRWASRITLTITDVRVERVQDISTGDAIAEGCRGSGSTFDADDFSDPVDEFRTLWDSISAARGASWDSNPWVWVIAFERTVGGGNG